MRNSLEEVREPAVEMCVGRAFYMAGMLSAGQRACYGPVRASVVGRKKHGRERRSKMKSKR